LQDNTYVKSPIVLTPPKPGYGFAPVHYDPGTPTSVYVIGGWDILTMKFEVLKYGVASTDYNTFDGASNTRPDSQLGGKLGEKLRNVPEFSTMAIGRWILQTFPNKPTAQFYEWQLVSQYAASHQESFHLINYALYHK
jgi:hypothetical protein